VGFIASRPKVDLRFLIGNRDATVECLREGAIEVALSGRPPSDIPVETFPIGPHPYVLIAPLDYRLAAAKGLTKADLAGEAFIFREMGPAHAPCSITLSAIRRSGRSR
jgi:LysR family transcriptional regulator, low CO2-responsive transcriptional regulator